MIHSGKNTKGELEVILTGEDIFHLYSMIIGTGLEERRVFHRVRTLIEKEFPEELK